MPDVIFTEKDVRQIKARGLTPDNVLAQIEHLKKGFPFSRLIRPCTVNDGISVIKDTDIKRLTDRYSEAASSGRFMKFVPASGAASRMFKLLLSVRNTAGNGDEKDAPVGDRERVSEYEQFIRFMKEIRGFAFCEELESVMSRDGLEMETLIKRQDYNTVLDYVLGPGGLNLADSPKGLIPFHKYSGYSRTPIEEHLVEAKEYVRDGNGMVRVHFTVSPEHKEDMTGFIDSILHRYEETGVRYDISFSTQKPSTDTIAVNPDNSLFREAGNNLLFRPAGHGALIVNLSEVNGDIIFIKNIDNVAPDSLKPDTYLYKKLLAGYLVELQDKMFGYMRDISSEGVISDGLSEEIFRFIRETFSRVPREGAEQGSRAEIKACLISLLERPVRVCGMVKNTGEPGGGPFWVGHEDGSVSVQIVEAPQVDMDNDGQKAIYRSSTHFNPVDLVCAVRNYKGGQYDLNNYIDPETGFISIKSINGRELKALELPGLWQGAMAEWNTVFIEVPITTFNPVKTIFDLLRPEHQA